MLYPFISLNAVAHSPILPEFKTTETLRFLLWAQPYINMIILFI